MFANILCGTLVVFSAATASAQVGAGGGGYGSTNWQITVTYNGSDTYVYPVYDGTLHGYRLRTDVRDWATNNWTLDGISLPGLGGPSNASWNTPTSFTGYAESKGSANVKVKWIGSGAAPTYCYLMLTSSAGAADQAENAGTYTASNGQGDPAISSTGSISSTGTHAKRLKLSMGGEATYTVSMNAKASRTGTSANLVASAAESHTLDVKAISLFIETYSRTPDNGADSGPVIRVPAWTGDIENELAEIAPEDTDLSVNIPVTRIGSWLHPEWQFTSSSSSGSRTENTGNGLPPSVDSITISKYYSLEQLGNMRTTPDIITLDGKQFDLLSTNVGPFNTKIKIKVWAPERILSKREDDTTETSHVPFPDGVDEYILYPGGSKSFGEAKTKQDTIRATVTVTGGYSATITPVKDIFSLGVKLDVGASLGQDMSTSYSYTTLASITCPSSTTPYRFFNELTVQHFNVHRFLGLYDSAGYKQEDEDTVMDYKKPYVTYISKSVPYNDGTN